MEIDEGSADVLFTFETVSEVVHVCVCACVRLHLLHVPSWETRTGTGPTEQLLTLHTYTLTLIHNTQTYTWSPKKTFGCGLM